VIEPQFRVEPFITQSESGRWLVTWQVTNLGSETLRLISARHPHSQFRTEETPLLGEVAAAATTDLTLPVAFSEPPGTVVENPFLILLVSDRHSIWRILARVRVTAGPSGEPVAGTAVTVTVNRVGETPT